MQDQPGTNLPRALASETIIYISILPAYTIPIILFHNKTMNRFIVPHCGTSLISDKKRIDVVFAAKAASHNDCGLIKCFLSILLKTSIRGDSMREFPRGGIIGKTVCLWRRVSGLRVPLYAANASFFLVLAAFPALLLLLGLLRYTPLEVERLGEMLSGFLPEALAEGAEELILLTYDNTSGITLGLSAVTTLWSASRGIYGMITGLNAVYEAEEHRGYVHVRLLSVIYTFAFLLVLILTLTFHVFGIRVLFLLQKYSLPFVRFFMGLVDFRFFLLLFLQTVIFTAMYLVLPDQKNRLADVLPGALLASSGWLIFSNLYSVYVEHFAHLSNVYGSVYAVALSMLWLYFCMAIVFYGGVLNRLLME